MKRPLLFLLFLVAACDSQVDGDHQGTALATLDGTVGNERAQPVTSADVMIAWISDGPGGDFVTGQRATVEGSFPASFSIAVYEPPADSVLVGYPGESKFGIAYIAAVAEGAAGLDEDTPPLGLDPEHMLVYVPEDVQAGSAVSYFLHGTPTAGFHVYGFRRLSDEERATREECKLTIDAEATIPELYEACGGDTFDEVVPLADDLATPLSVRLVDDLESLNLANWM